MKYIYIYIILLSLCLWIIFSCVPVNDFSFICNIFMYVALYPEQISCINLVWLLAHRAEIGGSFSYWPSASALKQVSHISNSTTVNTVHVVLISPNMLRWCICMGIRKRTYQTWMLNLRQRFLMLEEVDVFWAG